MGFPFANPFGRPAVSAAFGLRRSVRFTAADNARFTRTFGATGSTKKGTMSVWLKRASLGAHTIFGAQNTGAQLWDYIRFNSSDQLEIVFDPGGGPGPVITSAALRRDLLAFMHVVMAIDTTQGTAANRLRLYVNGVEQTLTGGTLSLNYDFRWNANGNTAAIGSEVNYTIPTGTVRPFDGLMSHFHWIDGTQYAASDFGQFDAITGRWVPKLVSGLTYGTNGFWLSFDNNASTTTLGYDDAGGAAGAGAGSNDWTPNNFSVTAGVNNDSLTDTPLAIGTDTGAGGEVSGNHCTLNPLNLPSGAALADGNLQWRRTGGTGGANDRGGMGTLGVKSGKYRFELWLGATIGPNNSIGMGIGTAAAAAGLTTFTLSNANTWGFEGAAPGKYVAGSFSAGYGTVWAANDVVAIEFDATAGTLVGLVNGVSQGTIATGLTNGPYFPIVTESVGGGGTTNLARYLNFGQRPWGHAASSGFKPWSTASLPTPAILLPSQYFSIALDTGANIKTTAEAIFSGSDFLEWIKDRANTNNHQLIDTVRGTSAVVRSNTTGDETTYSAPAGNSVGWVWKEAVTAGFHIVTFTGAGAGTVAHGLGVAPRCVLVKARSTAGTDQGAQLYHASLANTEALLLSSTAAKATGSSLWNSTSPTASVFSVGSTNATSGDTYVAYVFAEIDGFSKFGSYTGNASADGPFVYLGFKPRWLLIKRADSSGDWYIWDTSRDVSNAAAVELLANSTAVEGSGADLDILANGFKVRATTAGFNASGGTFVYMAFAEAPFQYANAR